MSKKSHAHQVTRNEFIFANSGSHRIIRHLVFWVLYSIYFYIQGFSPNTNNSFLDLQAYKDALVHSACFIPACIFSVYISIIFLVAYLLKRQYAAFISGLVLLCFLDTFINYLIIHFLHPHLSTADVLVKNTFITELELGYYNAYKAFVITGFVLGIVLAKNWYLQQKENLEMTRVKTETEINERKARINPQFIFRSLHSIYQKVIADSNDSPAMILRLSDLLSYSLYESNLKCVSLEKEVLNLQKFVTLEQVSPENFTNIRLEIKGTTANKYIVPLTLLSLIQNTLTIINDNELPSPLMIVNLSINKILSVKLTTHYQKHDNLDFFQKGLVKRMEIWFKTFHGVDNYEIKTDGSNQQLIINLVIPLLHDPVLMPSSSSLQVTDQFYETA